jgi:hypothetical protein
MFGCNSQKRHASSEISIVANVLTKIAGELRWRHRRFEEVSEKSRRGGQLSFICSSLKRER